MPSNVMCHQRKETISLKNPVLLQGYKNFMFLELHTEKWGRTMIKHCSDGSWVICQLSSVPFGVYTSLERQTSMFTCQGTWESHVTGGTVLSCPGHLEPRFRFCAAAVGSCGAIGGHCRWLWQPGGLCQALSSSFTFLPLPLLYIEITWLGVLG